ncbi:sodium:alanine symporter family protein [Chlamydiales bacterium]|nr:sodium:alanine symporter family protein [Chlamydiales bacterium]
MDWITQIHEIVWGAPLLILLIGVGVYLTIILKGVQFRYLGYALKLVFSPSEKEGEKGDISHFQSLMTALAATMGIGNIAGVATAYVMGGPGALFWMWVTALLGMAIKYAEAFLACKYRFTDKKGEMCGGPMYFIQKALGWKLLAGSFAFFGILGAFGGGNILQANSVADVMGSVFHVDPLYTGILLAATIGITLLGGIKSIGKVAGILVPVMALFYIGGALVVILICYDQIPLAIAQIFQSAFSPQAAVGGFTGSTIMMAMSIGVSKGLMTSESGLGTASIASAAAKTDHPGRQAMVSMTGSFLSTIVMCTVTALVLGVTGVLGMVDEAGNVITGASLTVSAFESIIPNGSYVVTIGLILFAFTTVLGWSYYGEKCVEYLLGERYIFLFRLLFTVTIVFGAIMDVHSVWRICDITNALMAFPNLIALAFLGHQVAHDNREFLDLVKEEELQLAQSS